MTRLFLLRHAKAMPAEPGTRDFDRPLDAKGILDAKALGGEMLARGLVPIKILCSAALRTRQTLEHVVEILPFESEIIYSDTLYNSEADGYLEEIMAHGDWASLLVIGHNPATEELSNILVSRHDKQSIRALMRGFPTCGLAHFEFESTLPKLAWHTGTLTDFIVPSDL